MNPLWARYMQQQQQQQQGGAGATAGSQQQFSSGVMCRTPQTVAGSAVGTSNPVCCVTVSPPITSLSSAIDRAKLTGMYTVSKQHPTL